MFGNSTTSTSASFASVAPANTLTGVTLASNVVTSSLTRVGTLTALTVSADATINSLRVGRGSGNDISNTAIGDATLNNNTTGDWNTAVGRLALRDNTIGGANTAIGMQAMWLNTSGIRNTAIGAYGMYSNISGSNNTSVGYDALASNVSGSNNTAIGEGALNDITGSNNIGIGRQAGASVINGGNNTIIGSVAGTAGLSDTVIIGAGTAERLRIDSSGNMGIGTTAPGARLHVQGNISASSFTGSLFGTASNAISASFATTASYVAAGSVGGTVLSASYAVTASNANLLDGYDSATTATANTIALRDNNGNVQFNRVGIGGTPSYDLHISKATSPSIYLESGNDDSKIYLTDTARYIAGIGGSAIGIYTNSGIRGRYDLYGTRVYGALGVGLTPDVGWTAGEIRATGNISATSYTSSISNGVGYFGTASFASISPANTLTGTTLASNVVASSLTSVGTLTGLTVSADATINSVRVGRGGGAIVSNTAMGSAALGANSVGTHNTAVGRSALTSNITGSFNTAIGENALFYNTSGSTNTAIGKSALQANTRGISNIANGAYALLENTSGSFNTVVGAYALQNNTTGNNNIVIGSAAGNSLTTGDNNTIIGSVSGSAGLSNTIIIAAGTTERLRIDSSSNMSISGSLTTTALIMAVSGTIAANSTTSVNLDLNVANYFSVSGSAAGTVTWTITNAPPANRAQSFVIEYINGGIKTNSWFTNTRWPAATAPILSTGTAPDLLGFTTDDAGANWRGVLLQRGSA